MKKDDNDTYADKSGVLQEARAFNESPINPRKCRMIITKLLWLLYNDEPIHTNEATETFFSITKLFQANDIPLRQIVYLAIKELSPIAQDVIMITASLTKDMNAKGDLIYRPNAIRALCKITDPSMLQAIERFLKQAIVDRNPAVASAALVSSITLFNKSPSSKEVVKRWVNEVQEAINAKGVITQYHALGLIYLIKQHDRMSVTKLVQSYSKGLKSTFAHCMLVRFTVQVLEDSGNDGHTAGVMFDLLESWLRHKNDMVVYESARAICNLPNVTQKELFPVVSALQLMLLNNKATLRFAAIRTLNKLAMTHPVAVWPCNLDMENLITDSNRSIATFAITTLLKTGTEASVDRLMKQITGFMPEISDEFKIIVIDAIRALCLKFPAKQSLMLNFLSNVLRDEGGFEYKRSIVEAIFDIIYHVPESQEYALGHLCEFIEDCEFSKLAVRILHLIGTEGPKTSAPSKYIRYIYNRVILENSTVRAAAVGSLAKFAYSVESLRPRIKVLLRRCLDDSDDEVRDRSAMYLRIIDNNELCKKYIGDDNTFSWAVLERNLGSYLESNSKQAPFDISSTPIVTKEAEENERMRIKAAAQETVAQAPQRSAGGAGPRESTSGANGRAAAAPAVDDQTRYAREMEKIPQLAKLGTLFKSSKPVELTESETEYVVSCIKHIFDNHVVFQFVVKNTIEEVLIENVTVVMEGDCDMKQKMVIPSPIIKYDEPGNVYVVWEQVVPHDVGEFACTLKFIQKEIIDGETEDEGYDDEYLLENVEVGLADYIQPLYSSDFRKTWEEYGSGVTETYSLTAVAGVKAAVSTLMGLLGMQPCDQSQTVKDNATTHTLLLTGTFMGSKKCFVRCRMAYDSDSGVTLEVSCRGDDPVVNERIANCIS